MSGTTGTIRSVSTLLTQLFEDGQAAGSISPQRMRDLIVSLQAISGVTSVAGRTGAISLLHGDIVDFATATVQALGTASLPQFTTLAPADQIFATSGGSGGWITFSALQTQLRGAATPQTVQASQPGTIVTTVGPTITDASGGVYGISSSGQVVFQGNADPTTSNVIELYYGSNGQIYWENSSGIWYTRPNPLYSWSQTSNPLSSTTPPPATSSGPGPSGLSGSLATINFASTTGVTAPAALWGIGAAELTNDNFNICTNQAFVTAAAAISPALLRINSNSGGSTGPWTDSIFAGGVNSPNWTVLANFMAVAYKFIQPTCRFIFGVKFYQTPTIGNPTDYGTACAAMVNYFKNNKSGSVYLPVWGVEVDNETDGKVDINTYCSYFNAAATAIHNIDPTINVIGPVYSWIASTAPDTRFQTFANTCGTSIGRFCYHSYRWDQASNGTPPNQDYYFQTTRPANDATVLRSSVSGTPAANASIFMGEYGLEDSAANVADEQNQINAVWSAFWMLDGFLSGKGVDCGAIWELSGDTTYGVIQNGVINPTGYFLSKAGQVMGGSQVSCTFGGGSSGSPPTISLATVNGGHFGVMLVNYSTSTGTPKDLSGTVALSSWPVNSSGNGIINRWECSPANPNGALSTLSVTGGISAATTVPAQSIVILYA